MQTFIPPRTEVVGLEQKVAFLSDPCSYPLRPDRVETVESHMSWIFLAGDEVYKLKKPVRMPFLDFRLLKDRERNCRIEVTLNQRLAPDVYRGVEALVQTPKGSLQIGGPGEAVDWLVHMRRLPAERMLDYLVSRRQATEADVRPAAVLLANFYRDSVPLHYDPGRYLQRFHDLVEENHRVLTEPAYSLPLEQCERLRSGQLAFLAEHEVSLRRRADHVVEAHGDLRPEHICLIQPPVVYDCLEFNREFRLMDPLDDLAFLTVECDVTGAAGIGRLFLQTYRNTVADETPPGVVAFYQCVRACVKAKLAVWHLRDDPQQLRSNWVGRAMRYLDRADFYLHRMRV